MLPASAQQAYGVRCVPVAPAALCHACADPPRVQGAAARAQAAGSQPALGAAAAGGAAHAALHDVIDVDAPPGGSAAPARRAPAAAGPPAFDVRYAASFSRALQFLCA